MKDTVGAGIVSIITESLYDKPIVVFREYIQNSADALRSASLSGNAKDLSSEIWIEEDDLLFLDNGTGIEKDEFHRKMIEIANYGKKKADNIGYKGIGRLSGIPYCRELVFINIIDYANRVFQEYVIDCQEYAKIRDHEDSDSLGFNELMTRIGTLSDEPNTSEILGLLKGYRELFIDQNSGFLVVLRGIKPVIKNIIGDNKILEHLGWLLPVPFMPELLNPTDKADVSDWLLFTELSQPANTDPGAQIPARSFPISFCGKKIYRPLTRNMLRTYLCKSNIEQYGICVHSFSNERIVMTKDNPFSGIRIYYDNMLLCDENELIPALQQYGFTNRGAYELIQSVRGVGAIIYITDKANLSTNARRTFIDVTDLDSLRFLELLWEFVDSIFQARYALSKYASAKRRGDNNQDKLYSIREAARQSLAILARSDITIETADDMGDADFELLPKGEQKRIIKSIISAEVNTQINKYLSQTDEYRPDTCLDDFKTWLFAN